MVDKFSKEKRSEIMSHIRGKDTKPEIKVRSAMHRMGYRFRKNDKRLPGTPDIYFPKYKTAVFINGCFWHGHENCKNFILPKSNIDYWKNKIETNIIRDTKNTLILEDSGVRVITIWECDINSNFEDTISHLSHFLDSYEHQLMK